MIYETADANEFLLGPYQFLRIACLRKYLSSVQLDFLNKFEYEFIVP